MQSLSTTRALEEARDFCFLRFLFFSLSLCPTARHARCDDLSRSQRARDSAALAPSELHCRGAPSFFAATPTPRRSRRRVSDAFCFVDSRSRFSPSAATTAMSMALSLSQQFFYSKEKPRNKE